VAQPLAAQREHREVDGLDARGGGRGLVVGELASHGRVLRLGFAPAAPVPAARWRLPPRAMLRRVVSPPNAISLVRVLLVPAVMALILADFAHHELWAAGAYVAAAASDTLDGFLARRRAWVTVTGVFLDPLADKLLVSGALVALVQAGRTNAWVAMIVIAREFAVSGLRLVAATHDDVVSASGLGKLKTFSQNVAIVALILFDPARFAVRALVGLALVLTVWSFVDYALRLRRHFVSAGDA
jgi:CDP-diacylglycerol--glycerol-3-phosphate 3-phosphatidyltransferase